MKASGTFVTIDKLTVRSFLKACAKDDNLQIRRASAEDSQARALDAKEKRLKKQLQKQRKEQEKDRPKERAQWIKQQMEQQTKGKKRTPSAESADRPSSCILAP
jgi:DNA-binding transcriptional regulator GbsR (MarR family)